MLLHQRGPEIAGAHRTGAGVLGAELSRPGRFWARGWLCPFTPVGPGPGGQFWASISSATDGVESDGTVE